MATAQGKRKGPAVAPAPGTYPSLLPIADIQARLQSIISSAATKPENSRNAMAAKTVATMLYGACIDGNGRYLRPSQVISMSDAQYAKVKDAEREQWWHDSTSKGFNPPDQWYRANTREGVRDNTLRYSMVPNQAVVQLAGVPVTSSKGRYALAVDFAALFDPALTGPAFDAAVAAWQSVSLGSAALARHVLLATSSSGASGNVVVTYPDKSTVSLKPGPSSEITKAVVEEFATRFLANASVIWLSESGQKVLNNTMAAALGLSINPAQQLPDLIIADVPVGKGKISMTFVEVVHTDGPINDVRKQDLTRIAQAAGFNVSDLNFVTAFNDRSGAYRSIAPSLAWGAFVWFRTEPDNIIYLRDAGRPITLTKLEGA